MRLDVSDLSYRAKRAIDKLAKATPTSKFVLQRTELKIEAVLLVSGYEASGAESRVELRVHYKEYDKAKYIAHQKDDNKRRHNFEEWRVERETFLIASQYLVIDILDA
jgi:hypothetical protein